MEDPLPYVPLLVEQFPSRIKNTSQAEDAVALYRRVLAAQPYRSVAISSIGIHTNLAALLRSPPDDVSPLNGTALVAEKVSLLAVMGGKYPASKGNPECNVCGGLRNEHNHVVASAAAAYVAAHWPASSFLLWSGFEVGFEVQSGGARFQKCPVATPSNPVRAAMVSYEGGTDMSRYSWDPLTTLVAVRTIARVPSVAACTQCNGTNSIDPESGNNAWVSGSAANQTYLVLNNGTAAGEALDELLCQYPKRASQATPVVVVIWRGPLRVGRLAAAGQPDEASTRVPCSVCQRPRRPRADPDHIDAIYFMDVALLHRNPMNRQRRSLRLRRPRLPPLRVIRQVECGVSCVL
eukprot:3307862-Prymnesium_polylepis.1